MKQIYILTIISLLNLNFLNAQTTFEWLTATDNGNTITETINGITVTFTGTNDATSNLTIINPNGYCNSSNNVIFEATDNMLVTFSFSEAVDMTSVLALNGRGQSNTYTFTPIGGNNSPVVTSIVSGCAPTVNLNWTGITSFSVSSPTNTQFGFDNLVINNNTLSINDLTLRTVKVFPNPSSDFIEITGLTAIEDYRIYNTLGQEVKKGIVLENKKIDIQSLTNGIYFLKFKNGNTIKFIKE
jgi:hypothetical protein